MNRTKNRKIIVARTALAAVAALGLLTAFMGQGFADPANNGAARAFGLEATGILPIAPTPEVSQVGEGRQEQSTQLNRSREALINLPVSNLAIVAALNTVAEVRLAGGINPAVAERSAPPNEEPVTERDVNARGYAGVTNLLVLVGNDPNDPAEAPELVEEALIDLKTVEAEAVAKCVNNRPVFETGYNIVGDSPDDVLGISLDPVEDLVGGLLDTLIGGSGDPNAANPNDGLLSSLVSIDKGVREPIPGGVRITALRIRVLGTTEVINVAQAEARMTEPCGVAAPAPPSPAARLAQTGGGGMSAVLGGSLLAGAVLMMVFVRKYRFTE